MESSKSLQTLMEVLEVRRRQIQECVVWWATNNAPLYPWRQSGKTPYEVLVGEALLKEKSSAVAVRTYQRFLQHFFSAKDMTEAGEDGMIGILCNFSIGEYTQRIKMMVKNLLKEGKGDLPRDSESYSKASGLEYHSIRAIFCFGYGLPIAVIDANAARMLSRLFNNTLPPRPEQGLLQAIGENLLPYANFQCYNRGLLQLGEVICQAEVPRCPICPLGDACDYVAALS